MSFLDIFKKYFKKRKIKLTLYYLIGIVSACLTLISPYIIGNFIDVLVKSKTMGVINRYALIFGIVNILNFILSYLEEKIYLLIQIDSAYEFNVDLLNHYERLPLKYSDKYDKSFIVQQFNNDSNELIIFLMDFILSTSINILTIVASSIVLFSLNKSLAISLYVCGVFYIVFFIIMKRKLYEVNFQMMEDQSDFFARSHQRINRLKSIKIHSLGKILDKNLDKSFIKLKKSSKRKLDINYIYSALSNLIQNLVQVLTFIYGGYLVIKNSMSIGEMTMITAFFSYILSSINYFFYLGEEIQSAKAMRNRINRILLKKPQTNGNKEISSIDCISIEGLNFSYGKQKLINDFSYIFKKGNLYLIKGENGKGKTTLVNLIIGLYIDEYSGKILINKENIENIDMISLRKKLVAYTEQKPFLISEEIEKIINDMNFSDLIEKFNLRNLRDHKIDEDNLSGGQIQKLSIIHGISKNPDLYIFDEPTSHMDKKSKEFFTKFIIELKKDKIVIIITHEDIDFYADEIIYL
ncbi:MAG: ABC transporter ATP-binding protein [Lagierella massiliensis]|nr:ABC transporter ATP-binding protein [Lagierella massiliensis]